MEIGASGLWRAARPRLRELEVELPGLPAELDGLRISHLSDFHFGVPSPGIGASWQAAEWVREREPDLVAVTGDLLTHPSAPYSSGIYRSAAATMHVSPGLGTTFVPFRFAAPPEATELVLKAGSTLT